MLYFFIILRTPSCDSSPSARKRIQYLSLFLKPLNLNVWCLRLRWMFFTWQLALAIIKILSGNPLAYKIALMKSALLSGDIGLDSSDNIRLTNISSSTLNGRSAPRDTVVLFVPDAGRFNWNLGQEAETFAVSLRISFARFLKWRLYQGVRLRSRTAH